MDLKNIGIFAAIAGVAAFWSQAKVIVTKVFSLFIRTDDCANYSIARVLARNVLQDCKIYRWGNRKYKTNYTFIKRLGNWGNILQLSGTSFLAIYKNKVPIIVSESPHGVKITYLFKTFPFEECLKIACDEFLLENVQYKDEYRFGVDEVTGEDFRMGGNGSSPPGSGRLEPSISTSSSEGPSSQKSDIFHDLSVLKEKNVIIGMSYEDTIAPKFEEKKDFYWSVEAKKLYRAVEFWLNQEKWFNDRQLRHSQSALATGRPGCGKSKSVLEIAKKLRIPLYKINISNMSDNEFIRAFENAPRLCIVLIEDICSIFEGRTNLLAANCLSKQLLSFDTLINVLSGVRQKDSCFVVVTSNHPEKLHESLTRRGRLNHHIEFLNITEDGRRFVANNILGDWPELMEKIVSEGDGDTASDFEFRCISAAEDKIYSQLELDKPENPITIQP